MPKARTRQVSFSFTSDAVATYAIVTDDNIDGIDQFGYVGPATRVALNAYVK